MFSCSVVLEIICYHVVQWFLRMFSIPSDLDVSDYHVNIVCFFLTGVRDKVTKNSNRIKAVCCVNIYSEYSACV